MADLKGKTAIVTAQAGANRQALAETAAVLEITSLCRQGEGPAETAERSQKYGVEVLPFDGFDKLEDLETG
jgi:hypothetical protein